MIDVHTHATPGPAATADTPPSIFRMVEAPGDRWDVVVDGAVVRRVDSSAFEAEARVERMDAEGVAHQVISPAPFLFRYSKEPDSTQLLARRTNEWIAAMVAHSPSRLSGLATITLQDPVRAVGDLRHAYDELGFLGVEIGTHLPASELDTPTLAPLWEELNEREGLAFIHPFESRQLGVSHHSERFALGYPGATATAFAALVAGRLPTRYPAIRWLLAHGGGCSITVLGRLDTAANTLGHQTTRDEHARTHSLDMLRSCWVDSLVYDPTVLSALVSIMGTDRVLLGTDFPFAARESPPGQAVRSAIQSGQLSEAEAAQILTNNAKSLLLR